MFFFAGGYCKARGVPQDELSKEEYRCPSCKKVMTYDKLRNHFRLSAKDKTYAKKTTNYKMGRREIHENTPKRKFLEYKAALIADRKRFLVDSN